MQITIEHGQKRPWYFLSFTIVFSPEELDTIKKRNLYDMDIVQGNTDKPYGPLGDRRVIAFLTLLFFGAAFFAAYYFNNMAHPVPQFLMYPVIPLGLYYMYLRFLKPYRGPRPITVRELLRKPTITVWMNTPVEMVKKEEELRAGLENAKLVIRGFKDLQPKNKYEL